MTSRIFAIAVTALLLAVPGTLEAQVKQTANVTLAVPLNLTDLSSDITWVKVDCGIIDYGLSPYREIKVSSGQVITTVNLEFTLTGVNLGIGSKINYACHLKGRTSTSNWVDFSDTGQAGYLYLRPTPAPLYGSFVL
jgi:hypothetical protein